MKTNTLFFDLKLAARALRRHKLANLAAIVSIGVAVGACTAVFSLVDATLLRPAPYPEPDRLALVWRTEQAKPDEKRLVPPDLFEEWRHNSKLFESMAAFVSGTEIGFDLESPSGAERVAGAMVSASFFAALKTEARFGRVFQERDDASGETPVVILSHGLWNELGSDPAILGRPLRLSGRLYEVVGVLPAWFQFPAGVRVWLPRPIEAASTLGMDIHPYFGVVGRLKPGVRAIQAEQELDGMESGRSPDGSSRESLKAKVVSMHTALYGEAAPMLAALLGAVLFVVLIACANVASLRLAQIVGRESETALSAALGASRTRLAFKSLLESFLLAFAGWFTGALALFFSVRVLEATRPVGLFPGTPIDLDWRVLAFALSLLILVTVAIGLAPALQASRLDLHTLLRSGRSGAGRRRRLGKLLVAGEVALAAVLLVGSTLMIRSLLSFASIDSGFQPDGAVVFKITPPTWKYSEDRRRTELYGSLREALKAIPGSVEVGAVNLFPLSGGRFPTEIAPQPSSGDHDTVEAEWLAISPGFLTAFGVPALAGRDFSALDRDSSEPSAIIDRSLAERLWPGAPALGKSVLVMGVERRVVGVVGDVSFRGFGQSSGLQIYVPEAQSPLPWPFMSFVVRASGEPSSLIPAVRSAVARVDPDLAVEEPAPLRRRFDESFSTSRFAAKLLTAFACLALLLAGLGVYSCLAGLVENGANEIGVRMALGATRTDILRSVLGRGFGLTIGGLAAGTALAAPLSRLVVSLLYGVTPLDPLAYAAAWLVLLTIAAAASWVPAHKATKLDPVQTLRSP